MVQANYSYMPVEDGAGMLASVAIFADRAGLRLEIAEDMTAAGFRIGASAALNDLVSGGVLDLGDVVVLDVPVVDAETMAALARLDMRIARAGAQLVISTSLDALDAVFASFDQCAPQILVNATRLERVVAVGRTLGAISGSRLRELSDADRMALLRLSEQVDAIAQRIEGLRQLGDAPVAGASSALADPTSAFKGFDDKGKQEPTAKNAPRLPAPAAIRQVIADRRARDKFFEGELFADPAWDMLLDLSASYGEGVEVSVSSLCIAAAVPPTTALRWIRQMTESGIFTRIDDTEDRRRAFISLSSSARDAMARYFASIKTPLALAA